MLLFYNNLISQTNLIKNGSFEIYQLPIDCNGGAFDIAGSPTFHHVVDYWYTQGSPDYFNSACVSSWYNVPLAVFGESYAKQGTAYSGFALYKDSPGSKEYIYQNLVSPLKMDSTYCLSFFVTLADRTTISVKQVGAYFSNNAPNIGSSNYLNYSPQIENTSGFVTDTANWVEIQGCFTAQGGEQYITIGNFNSNINTDTATAHSTNPLTGTGNHISYYYVDSVSLWKNNFPTTIKEQSNDGLIKVYPNPVSDLLNIKYEAVISIEKLNIKITDVLGREVFISAYKEKLDLSKLENGIYFISVQEGSKNLGFKKFIKQ